MKGAHEVPPPEPRDTDDGVSGDTRDRSQAERLIEMVTTQGVTLFHAPDSTAYAIAPIGGQQQVLELRAKRFRSMLYRLFYDKHGKPPGNQAVQDALGVLEAKALFEGHERPVHVRLAEHDGKIYLDLADEHWRIVEIDTTGWRVIDRAPVMFRRPKGLAPLPVPIHGGTLVELLAFVNVDEDEWPLLVGFLLACLSPTGPYPLLVIVAEQGAGKSSQARMLKQLVDPNMAPLRSAPRDERDLLIGATNSWLLAFDNLSGVQPTLSDALCRLSTGGGYATRELYANTEETIIDAMRPVVLTGIDDLATRADLLDRSIVLSLPRITTESRLTERELFEAYNDARPRILGALLTAVSGALARLPHTKIDGKPRMADFATWATAGEEAAGLEPGSILQAYRANRASANSLALDASPLPHAITEFAQRRGEWEGTAGDLLNELDQAAGDTTRRHKAWPKSASSIAQKLRRIAPNLREIGVDVDFIRTSTARFVRLAPQNAVMPSSPSSTLNEPRQGHETTNDGNSDGTNDSAVMEQRAVIAPSSQERRPGQRNDSSDGSDSESRTRSTHREGGKS